MDINSGGRRVYGMPDMPPDNKRRAGGLRVGRGRVRIVRLGAPGSSVYARPALGQHAHEPPDQGAVASACAAPIELSLFQQPALAPGTAALVIAPCRLVRYWACSSKQASLCYAATIRGLDRTADKGLTWAFVKHAALAADSRGSFLDSSTTPPVVYHATPAGIFQWTDGRVGATLKTVREGCSVCVIQGGCLQEPGGWVWRRGLVMLPLTYLQAGDMH